MVWMQLLNKESQIERFQRAYARNRLASTYLFVGKPGIGKRKFAVALAQALLCENPQKVSLDPCGDCVSCLLIQKSEHPDLVTICRPEDKSTIPVAEFIGEKDSKLQNGLIYTMSLKSFRGGWKVAIIDDADYLNQEGANSLLKLLEEPPPKTVLILIGTSQQQQLPTILSRCQIFRFEPLTRDQILSLLQQQEGKLETEVPLEQLAGAAAGSMEWALALADTALFDFREVLLKRMVSNDPGDQGFCQNFERFLESLGKENKIRRDTSILLADILIHFFQQALLRLSGVVDSDELDTAFERAVDGKVRNLKRFPLERAEKICLDSIERTLDFQQHIRANVSPKTAVDGWIIDLVKIHEGSYLPC
jgi:DNA polymerase-3 subunit delta'